MKEEFLHYLWKQKLYINDPLLSGKNELIDVISSGEQNFDSGPDFFNAKIKIGNTIWAGNVEIHVSASDWKKHNHSDNKAYENVILHVVVNDDLRVKRSNGEEIPTLKLEWSKSLQNQYIYLMNSTNWIPCETFINRIDDFIFFQWKEALLVERLNEKSELIKERFLSTNNNWEETFYQTLAYNFGFNKNSHAFELLAKSLPLTFLGKHKDQLELIEAMLFGQAGLIPENPSDNYSKKLKRDYHHLATKFSLKPISKSLWKFMRMRPGNFPTLRIAQFAHLIYKSTSLLSKILDITKPEELLNHFLST